MGGLPTPDKLEEEEETTAFAERSRKNCTPGASGENETCGTTGRGASTDEKHKEEGTTTREEGTTDTRGETWGA